MDFSVKFNAKAMESSVRDYLDNLDLRDYLENELAGKEIIGYIEGPPTMNGEPHAGHLRAELSKISGIDLILYKRKKLSSALAGIHKACL